MRTLYNIEKNIYSPSLDILLKLSDKFGIELFSYLNISYLQTNFLFTSFLEIETYIDDYELSKADKKLMEIKNNDELYISYSSDQKILLFEAICDAHIRETFQLAINKLKRAFEITTSVSIVSPDLNIQLSETELKILLTYSNILINSCKNNECSDFFNLINIQETNINFDSEIKIKQLIKLLYNKCLFLYNTREFRKSYENSSLGISKCLMYKTYELLPYFYWICGVCSFELKHIKESHEYFFKYLNCCDAFNLVDAYEFNIDYFETEYDYIHDNYQKYS